mgnify:CR=1 FL=1
MIKKFEEFVNEMYSPTSVKRGVFDFIDYLESIGMTDDNIRAEIYDIAMNNRNFYYTPEETENISYSLFLKQTRWMMQQRTQKRPDRSSLICPV